nr:ATP-binding protein [Kofleriaceae bacterium]
MKLRGRFTLALALAALVPIAIAAVVTRQVIVSSSRDDYESLRRSTFDAMTREVGHAETDMFKVTRALASPDNPFIANLAHEVAKSGNHLSPQVADSFYDRRDLERNAVALDELTIIGPDSGGVPNGVLVGHSRGSPKPEIRRLANLTNGARAYFAYHTLWDDRGGKTEALLVESTALSVDRSAPELSLAFMADRRIDDDLLEIVRRTDLIDARVVLAKDNRVILPPHSPEQWASLAKEEPLRIPLPDADDKAVAFIEIAVGDRNLQGVLEQTTLVSAVLALVAFGGVVLIGLLVARRTARDLEKLVEGSLAAARGDLDHRVPVRSQDEIGAVASAFNFMMEDLRTSKERLVIAERIAAWQEIARRLAHEIKNPLTPIQMAMDTLRKSWRKQHPSFTEILEESTTTVLQEADRLKHIVTEFSDFARMPKPEFGRVDVNDLVRGSLSLYQGAVPVEAKLAESLPTIDADKNQLNQVLLNLVENARDAISQRVDPTTGHIAVSTKLGEAADRVMLTVEDNGPGVPTELKDKVFAPYFTTKHSKGGTGLGLAIVHRIVSDHGGRITISDARGGGARFTIEIPLRNGTALLASRI